MPDVSLGPAKCLKGEVIPPSDKSISHRSIMLASLAKGKSEITGFLRSEDTMCTVNVFRALGVDIEEKPDKTTFVVDGKGLDSLKEAQGILDCGNSGTTMRMSSGILAGFPFMSILSGDASLSNRPMLRIVNPLREMGATVLGRNNGEFPPIVISGGDLRPIIHKTPVPSAQAKSAVLLAGLFTEGTTGVIESVRSRDHTERMLRAFGADVKVEALKVSVKGRPELTALNIDVPSDFSSAAFFIAAALLVEGSELTVRSVCLNPTRTGLLDVLRQMGADIEVVGKDAVSGEPVGDIHCKSSGLKGIEVSGDMIPSFIDEFPVFCVLAAAAEGETVIRDAGELRVKESDRITAMAKGLRAMGVEIEEFVDGMRIKGGSPLKGADIHSHGDHRIAMAFSIAALIAEGETRIENSQVVDVSFPGFYSVLEGLIEG
ncbi:MAG: 3-phosphoshikimate 1-carboxyvinyltransferase [Thermodesulfovibrionales bacterium]|nr:3-phosphoshikimate 1-carboxyvinyltransferase [Thermodesulfovibrionales bacterium]